MDHNLRETHPEYYKDDQEWINTLDLVIGPTWIYNVPIPNIFILGVAFTGIVLMCKYFGMPVH